MYIRFLDPTVMRRVACWILLGATVGALSACDSAGPAPSLESSFDMQIGEPVSASVNGAAALGNGLSFDQQGVFTLPVPPLGKTISIVQLSGQLDQGGVHDLAFMQIAEEPLGEGSYELGATACKEDCEAQPFPPEELFLADYSRRTVDSLHSYPIDAGSVTVETATESGVEGTFSLTASREVSVARADLQAFLDELQAPSESDSTSFPSLPPMNRQELEGPMTIEGSFTATSEAPLSNQVPHLGGFGLGGGMASAPATMNP